MTVQKKLSILAYSLLAFCIAGIVALHHSHQRVRAELYADLGRSSDAALAAKSASLRSFVNEYSYWDDLVSFTAGKHDTAWAERTFAPCLGEYGSSAVWIYRPDFSPGYTVAVPDEQALDAGLIPPIALKKSFADKNQVHFYVPQPHGVIEVFGASIHPTADSARKTPPQGYLLAARRWTPGYIEQLAKTTGMQLAVIAPDGRVPVSLQQPRNKDTVVITRPLAGWDGKPAMAVAFAAEAPVIKNIERRMQRQLYGIAAVSFLLVALIYGFLSWWITAPLNLLYAGLDAENMGGNEKLLSDRSEFGYIAQLVARVFEQKAHLLAVQTSLAEEKDALEQKVAELSAELAPLQETMRQVTINRETTERLTREVATLRQAETIVKNAYAELERKLKESNARLHVVSELLQREILCEHEHREAELMAVHERQEAEAELARLKFQLEQRTAELQAANHLIDHELAEKKIDDKKSDLPEIKFEARC